MEAGASTRSFNRSPHGGRSLNIANLPPETRDELNHRTQIIARTTAPLENAPQKPSSLL
jgi:hypothetical protein